MFSPVNRWESTSLCSANPFDAGTGYHRETALSFVYRTIISYLATFTRGLLRTRVQGMEDTPTVVLYTKNVRCVSYGTRFFCALARQNALINMKSEWNRVTRGISGSDRLSTPLCFVLGNTSRLEIVSLIVNLLEFSGARGVTFARKRQGCTRRRGELRGGLAINSNE